MRTTLAVILVVDDNTDLLGLNTFMLKNLDYDVITATNGEEAVAAYKTARPDIVIMDIKMPKMDGFDAFFKIKKMNQSAKIILISAYAIDEKKLLNAQSMGLLNVINKPYEFDDIEKLIKEHVGD
ncbi:response regulator receiver protein [Nitrosopumilus maritimus SCM1]|uniref:Response regulator receiver protein n=1 Tax=Nitrosopumilus maritimus (strain SCM1) TaxID=436308 RepID=A9A5U3_NITMS|nr:response regulator receiver protein [Nitrosopumilus maritimus SCM1]